MIDYHFPGTTRKYSISYGHLREDHYRFVSMTDEEFMRNLPDAAHLACVISWLKESGNSAMSDEGIVHQVIHLMTCPQSVDLHEIRDQFKQVLHLS